MNDEYRKKLLSLVARIEQQIAGAESLTVEALEDEILISASEQLADLRRVLANVELKLRDSE